MSAPPKPWEQGGTSYRIATDIPTAPSFSRGPVPSAAAPTVGLPRTAPGRGSSVGRSVPAAPQGVPPPLPPRFNQSAPLYNAGSSMRSMYSPYGGLNSYGGYSGFGGYSPYGGYGSYGSSYGGYGLNRLGNYMPRTEPESRFIRLAEESTRPAFQSIESLVQAFSSVTFMLESTFGAIHNSFRAVLSVAENMGRLRSVFGQFFSVFAIFRTLQWLYKKCLYLLGLIKLDPSNDEIWQQTITGAGAGEGAAKSRVSWPVLILMGLMLSGPYLMWKLLNTLKLSVSSDSFDINEWKRSRYPTLLAVAQYDFQATSDDELSFRAGTRILIAPKDFQSQGDGPSGWLLATIDGKKAGFVPLNRLQVTGRLHYTPKQHERTVPTSVSMSEATENPVADTYMESAWTSLPTESATDTSSSVNQSTGNVEKEVEESVEL